MRGYHECPKCGAEHKISRKECGCGYVWADKLGATDPLYGCCEYMSGMERCHYPGVYKSSTDGSGRAYCKAHERLPEPALGHRIVMRSHEEIPHPDYSLESRRKHSEEVFREKLAAYKGPTARKLATHRPNKDWAHKIIARQQAGEVIPTMALAMAQSITGPSRDRVPGEDDE